MNQTLIDFRNAVNNSEELQAQATECWCPDEAVNQELAVLGWPEEVIWWSEKKNQEARPSAIIFKNE